MEKRNMYPEMPPLPGGMPDAPPSYNQSFNPSAPSSADMAAPMMSSYGPGGPRPQPIMVQTMAPPIPPLGPRPCLVVCPSCREQKMSNIRMESTTKTHLAALIMCLVGLCCCACIPYCVDSCKNANHYCGNCDAYLGSYSK
ncbi:lipopolysaccharide-induced tumor necrosis factor-alpha factor-like [Eupeodes corollae]|uniref:lipopolysaccharide-induced tumor necrosis factor-alpha factor-like n=1 Tax=Eupeodes corollae TaxID=290404 RepID=UPI0024934321|nr:lipopolysaccharide-induced tumor necrosis factor-alpha factor-like [Eupeodes corollae]